MYYQVYKLKLENIAHKNQKPKKVEGGNGLQDCTPLTNTGTPKVITINAHPLYSGNVLMSTVMR